MDENLPTAVNRADLSCPQCGCTRIVKNGHQRGAQRFLCKECNRTFRLPSPAKRAGIRLVGKFHQFRQLCSRQGTLRQAARQLEISVSTAFRWRHMVLSQLASAQATAPVPTINTALVTITPCFSNNYLAHSNTNTAQRAPIIGFPFVAAHLRPIAWVANVFLPSQDRKENHSFILRDYPTPVKIVRAARAKVNFGSLISTRWMSDRVGARPADNIHPGPNEVLSVGRIRPVPVPLRQRYGPLLASAQLTFYRWMRAFHGISLRYLEHYTAWYCACLQ